MTKKGVAVGVYGFFQPWNEMRTWSGRSIQQHFRCVISTIHSYRNVGGLRVMRLSDRVLEANALNGCVVVSLISSHGVSRNKLIVITTDCSKSSQNVFNFVFTFLHLLGICSRLLFSSLLNSLHRHYLVLFSPVHFASNFDLFFHSE